MTLVLAFLAAAWLSSLAQAGSFFSRGLTLIDEAKYDEAIAVLKEAEKESPQEGAVQYWLGYAQYQQYRFPEAIGRFRRAVESSPNAVSYHLWLGKAHIRGGSLTVAISELSQAVALDSRQIEAYLALGMALALTGKVESAADQFLRVIDLAPNSSAAQTARDWITALKGQADLAKMEPRSQKFIGHFLICYDEQDPAVEEVAKILEEAHQTLAKDFEVELPLSRVLIFRDRTSYQQYCLSKDPTNLGTMHSLASSSPGMILLWSPTSWCKAIPPTPKEFLWSVLPHEYAHLVVAYLAGGRGVPRWLDEGIACYYGRWGGTLQSRLSQKTASPLYRIDDALISHSKLHNDLAYAQVYSMVNCLFAITSQEAVARLVIDLGKGKTPNRAFLDNLAMTQEQFFSRWKRTLPAE